MITLRKRIFSVGTPAILAAVLVAGTLGATELISSSSAGTETASQIVEAQETAQPARAGKGNLKVELADVHGRPTRCVSGEGVTTCTGWPVSNAVLAYNSE